MKKQYDKSKTKPRMTASFYEKAFDSFNSMVDELRNLHPEFSHIFTYAETNTSLDAAADAVNYFKNNMPNVATRENIPTSISVNANRVLLKTNKFFSIEWSFKYDREGNITDLVATIATFTKDRNAEELETMIEVLKNSWSVKEITGKDK